MPNSTALLPRSMKRFFSIALTSTIISLAFWTMTPAKADHLDDLGMAKLAEMAAIARHSDECPTVPKQWSIALMTLLIMHTPTEQQVHEQERQALALRKRIGQEKWCALYAAEMEEAFLIYRMAIGR